ncbi:hypothetical protein BHAOGJBA_1232 [Methylobacterium hispanicum]|uniref:Uncharacterized protein n=1 Tax=Methylobacterium hispanicum TaxID=270350 RepID=A0AAV4ZH75_9HYPH|nr:hypothetical protein [Methylobacterium hispanicum]GJD87727.1 hypothetical protein BHAOGJBA_1232 [Methylobacterium hispanicum]
MNSALRASIALLFGLNFASNVLARDLEFRSEDASGNSITFNRSVTGPLPADTELPQLGVFQRLSKVLADFSPWSASSLARTPIPGKEPAPAKESPSLSCSVAVEGRDEDRLKTISIKLTANVLLDADASLRAVLRGRGETKLTTVQPVLLKAGETMPFKVGRTNIAPEAKLTASVKLHGAEYPCD